LPLKTRGVKIWGSRQAQRTLISRVPALKETVGLEKRVEDISEALTTEIRNNTAEVKGSLNEMRNTPDGMNSRMEEAENQINDLENRVM